MASVKIVIRKKPNSAGLLPLAIRLTKDRKTSYLYTGQYIEEKFWDEKNKKIRKSHPNSRWLNNYLLKKLSDANEKMLVTDVDGQHKSASKIKNIITNKNKADFFYAAQIYFNKLKSRHKYDQITSYTSQLKVFKDFLGKSELAFNELTDTLLRQYETYLLHEKEASQRTVASYLVLIRLIYNLAIDEEITDRRTYPFGKGKIQIKIPESEKIGLSKAEVQRLEKVKGLTEAQKHAVNLWLFSFYFAGIRVADVLKMRWSDFKDDRLYYCMGKNNKLVSLAIPVKAQNILDIYNSDKDASDDLIFPYLQNSDFKNLERLAKRIKTINRTLNRRLELVAEKLELNKKLSMHIARHTFGNISGDGMEEYIKELVQEKPKELIPPFDMDKFENHHIHIGPDEIEKSKDKDKDREIDI